MVTKNTPLKNNKLIGFSGRIGSGKDLFTLATMFMTSDDKEIRDAFYENPTEAINTYQGVVEFNTRYVNKKFASKIKQIVALLLNKTIRDLEDKVFVNEELGDNWWYYLHENKKTPYLTAIKNNDQPLGELVKLTPRRLMVLIGTEGGRDIIHPDIWVSALFSGYMDELFWIISDVRFPNEIDVIHNKGGYVIRIVRSRLLSEWLELYTLKLKDLDGDDKMMSDYEFTKYLNEWSGAVPVKILEKINHPSECSLDGTEFEFTIYNDSTIESAINQLYDIYNNIGVLKGIHVINYDTTEKTVKL